MAANMAAIFKMVVSQIWKLDDFKNFFFQNGPYYTKIHPSYFVFQNGRQYGRQVIPNKLSVYCTVWVLRSTYNLFRLPVLQIVTNV